MQTIIAETFNYFQNKKFDIEYRNSSFSYSLKGAHLLPPQCNIQKYENNSVFYFEDCTITIFSQFELKNGDQVILTDDSSLIDLSIKNFSLTLDTDHYSISAFYLLEMKLNEYKPYLKSSLFQGDFRIGFQNTLDKYYKDSLNNYLYPSAINKKDEVNAILTMLFMTKPYFNTESTNANPKVTYFSYLSSQCKNFINTKEFVRMGDLRINIEYSIDFNLNYKSGFFKISNTLFMNQNFVMSGDIDFQELFTQNISEEIKQFLVSKFLEDLEKARREYYSSNNKFQNKAMKILGS